MFLLKYLKEKKKKSERVAYSFNGLFWASIEGDTLLADWLKCQFGNRARRKAIIFFFREESNLKLKYD